MGFVGRQLLSRIVSSIHRDYGLVNVFLNLSHQSVLIVTRALRSFLRAAGFELPPQPHDAGPD